MPEQDSKLKKQRDQFLAFAFASADLFLEVAENGKIQFALGASKGMTGISDKEMLGMNWLNLFSAYDQATLLDQMEKSKPGKRWGPVLVDLNEEIIKRKGVLTGIKMPDSPVSYLTLGLSNALMGKLAATPKTMDKDLADVSTFIDESIGAMDFASSLGEDAAITLFDFGFTDTIEEEFGPENWGKFQEDLRDLLQAHSLNSANPGKFDNSHFALTHSTDIDTDELMAEVTRLIEAHAPDGTTGYKPEAHTVAADLSKISEWETEKAIDYLVTGFVAEDEKAPEYKIEKLSGSIDRFARGNTPLVDQLKTIIERVDFSLKFTPVINLETEGSEWHEIIPVFNEGDRKQWMMLAEDTGLSVKFDLAYCERAVNHVIFKAGGSRSKFSATIQAPSAANENFLKEILKFLDKGKDHGLSERLAFEIARSESLIESPHTARFIKTLTDRGFKITLDDASLTPATIKNMQKFNIEGVKLATKLTAPATMTDKRKIKSLEKFIALCRKRSIPCTAKNILSETQIEFVKNIGVSYAQGPHFGTELDNTSFQPPQK